MAKFINKQKETYGFHRSFEIIVCNKGVYPNDCFCCPISNSLEN